MQWPQTIYGIHLLTTASSQPPLYRWQLWQNAYPLLDSLIALSKEKAAIRSTQSFKGDSKWLPFGRMIWSKKNNEKWSEKYRSAEHSDRVLEFMGTEVWAPDWNTAWKQEQAPDIFIKLDKHDSPQLQQSLLIAVREPVYTNNTATIRGTIQKVAELLPSPIHYFGRQRWAEEVWDSGYRNGLSDRSTYKLVEQLIRVAA